MEASGLLLIGDRSARRDGTRRGRRLDVDLLREDQERQAGFEPAGVGSPVVVGVSPRFQFRFQFTGARAWGRRSRLHCVGRSSGSGLCGAAFHIRRGRPFHRLRERYFRAVFGPGVGRMGVELVCRAQLARARLQRRSQVSERLRTRRPRYQQNFPYRAVHRRLRVGDIQRET